MEPRDRWYWPEVDKNQEAEDDQLPDTDGSEDDEELPVK